MGKNKANERKEGMKEETEKISVPIAEKANVPVKQQDEWDNSYCIGLSTSNFTTDGRHNYPSIYSSTSTSTTPVTFPNRKQARL